MVDWESLFLSSASWFFKNVKGGHKVPIPYRKQSVRSGERITKWIYQEEFEAAKDGAKEGMKWIRADQPEA